MKTPKTVVLIECRTCNGCYYGGDQNITLHAGDERTLPDEISVVSRRVSKCQSCKEREDRTYGGKRKKFER